MAALLALALPLLSLTPSALASPQRGLGYNDVTWADWFSEYSDVTWGYNWGYPSQGLSSRFEYVPMLWGNPTGNPSYISGWEAEVSAAASSGTQHLLAFNEPDINNLSPADAATAYQNYMQPYAGQFQLGAPAVTNGGAPTGLTWLDQFLGNCTSCRIDFVPIHWYDSWDNIGYFTSYVEQAYAAGGYRPLWITEFEGEGNDAQQIQFIQTVLPWLDSLSYVQRYSYFGVFENLLINSDGTGISDIGQAYGSSWAVNSTTPTNVY